MAEVLLLVHRSGCIQLTMVLRLPNNLPIDSLVSAIVAKDLRIVQSEVAEPILRASADYVHASQETWSGNWAEGEAQGVRWRQLSHEPAATLSDFFEMYRDAIEQVANIRSFGTWRCHPVVFIDSLGCCNSERQRMQRHKDDLLRVVARTPRLALRKPFTLEDQALTKETSVYCEAGSTSRIRWRFTPGRSNFSEQLNTVVVIEHAFLRYWQLVTLSDRVASVQDNSKSIVNVQYEAIFGLQEYRRSVLVFDTAQEMVDRLLSQLGEDGVHSQILDSLGLLQQMIATESAKRSARTQNVAAAIAVLATMILGLPSVAAILSTIKSVPLTGVAGKIASPLHALARRGALGVWEGYLALVLVVLVVMIGSVIRRRVGVRRLRTSIPGVSWDFGTVEIVHGSSDETAPVKQSKA